MGSLVDQTEAALARVLSLCNGGVGQQDVDALQRHDEAALAMIDINDDDSVKVCGSQRRCKPLSNPTFYCCRQYLCRLHSRQLSGGTTDVLCSLVAQIGLES